MSLRREIVATLRLGVPLALTQLSQMAMSFVDVMMVGRLGPQAMAAAVLGSSTFFTLALICVGMVMAVNPTVAQAHGAGRSEDVGRAARQGLWLGAALGVPLFVLMGFGERAFLLAGQEPETAALAGDYLAAIRWGVFPNLWFTALRGFCEGLSRPRPVLVITLVGVGVNVIANDVLMYGRLGFPALGVVGTGWSSAVVMTILFLLLTAYVRWSRGLRVYRVFAGLGRPDSSMLSELFRLGWPIGTQFGLEGGLFLALTLVVGLFGTEALAAHQVALNASGVAFMVPLGIGMAATVRVGQETGAGRPGGARRAGFVAVTLGAVVMMLSATLFWVRPEWVTWIYTGETRGALAERAATLLAIAAVFQIVDGVQATAAGALRGLKDTRVPMLIGAASYWGVGLGAGAAFGLGLGWGARGAWWGVTAGLATAAVLLTLRFERRSGASPEARG